MVENLITESYILDVRLHVQMSNDEVYLILLLVFQISTSYNDFARSLVFSDCVSAPRRHLIYPTHAPFLFTLRTDTLSYLIYTYRWGWGLGVGGWVGAGLWVAEA